MPIALYYCVLIKLLGTVIIISSIYYNWQQYILRLNDQSIVYLWYAQGKWGVANKVGHCKLGILLADSYKCAWFIILHIQFKTGNQRILIPYDALSITEYRTLMLYTHIN